jgi:hypothetical protein
VLAAWKGKKGRQGKRASGDGARHFKVAQRGSRGGGVRAGPTPHSEEVGEGPGLTVRRRAAGNDPTAVRAGGARVGGTQTGEDGALTCGPGHCGGF